MPRLTNDEIDAIIDQAYHRIADATVAELYGEVAQTNMLLLAIANTQVCILELLRRADERYCTLDQFAQSCSQEIVDKIVGMVQEGNPLLEAYNEKDNET